MRPQVIIGGIDVSKDNLVCFIDCQLSEGKSHTFSVTNNGVGINLLIDNFKSHFDSSPSSCTWIIESTGDYHILACLLLKTAGFDVRLINHILTNQAAKHNIRKIKSDPSDAKLLAKLGQSELDLPVFDQDVNTVVMRKKLSLLKTCLSQHQALKAAVGQFDRTINQLQAKIPGSVIGLEKVLKELEIVLKTMEAEIVTTMKNSNSNQIPPLFPPRPNPKAKISSKPIIVRLDEIPGVTAEMASLIMAHLHGKHFNHGSELVAFTGLDVSVKESGKWCGKTRLSKRGSPYLRRLLFQCAWGLQMHQPQFTKLYQYYKQKGFHYFAVINILARKFLHIIHSMIKYQTEFNPKLVCVPS